MSNRNVAIDLKSFCASAECRERNLHIVEVMRILITSVTSKSYLDLTRLFNQKMQRRRWYESSNYLQK